MGRQHFFIPHRRKSMSARDGIVAYFLACAGMTSFANPMSDFVYIGGCWALLAIKFDYIGQDRDTMKLVSQ
jgi:hypothetical protein